MSDRRFLPEHPDLRVLRREAKARRAAGEFPTLARAQLALAREYGFASWPRLKLHVESLSLDLAERARRLVQSACSANLGPARALLELDPGLAGHDLACACVAGDVRALAKHLERAPGRAGAAIGPLERPPIHYACFSRLGRSDPARAAGIREVVAALIAAGADPDARVQEHGWIQSTLYGAAGIAGDPELTAMLLAAGADPDDDGPVHTVGEALYHACEHRDPECARLLIAAGTKRSVVDYCLGRALDFPNPALIHVFCDGGARPSGEQLAKAVRGRRGPETVGRLLDAGAPVDGGGTEPTPLALAVCLDESAVAELLLARGADPARVTDADRALGARLGGRAAGAAGSPPELLDDLLVAAIDQGDAQAVRRLLDAGARVDGAPGVEHRPIGVAAWHGRAAVAGVLADHGAALAWADGSAIGAALHGSRHCQDPEGGPTMGTREEIDAGRYRETLAVLLGHGAPVPERLGDAGPRSATLLAELGVGP